MAATREHVNRSFENLQAKYVGTGNPDTTKHEWVTNHHRDTLASQVGHYSLLSYFAVAENQSIGRVRTEMLERMLQPCGPPPARKTSSAAAAAGANGGAGAGAGAGALS